MVTARTSLLVSTEDHGRTVALSCEEENSAGIPVRIACNSPGDTRGCSSGLSRETIYQTVPASTPMAAQNQNDDRQPWVRMM